MRNNPFWAQKIDVRHPINCRMMLLRCIYVCGKVIPFCNCILTEDASTSKNAKLNLGS